MSQPRRRRRRRRKQPQGGQAAARREEQRRAQPEGEGRSAPARRRRRRRRGRAPAESAQPAPLTLEDIARKERPETLTAPPDGTTLEEVIGDLQSQWGVPESPQEYRITLKVTEEREARTVVEDRREEPSEAEPPVDATGERPRRERAPAAPRIAGAEPTKRRRRGRRRRRRGGGA